MWKVGEYYQRLAADTAYRRGVLLLLFVFAAFLGEVFLLYFDLSRHKEFVLHAVVSVAIVLLPFTMLAVIARLPFGKRVVKSQFVIRPFGTMAGKSEWDGTAIASLLYREISAWQSQSSKGTIEGRGGKYSIPAAHVSLGVTSVPLDWLWIQIRFLVTGKRDVIVEGLLIDSDRPFQLKIWTSDSAYTWTELLGEGPFSEALGKAIQELTPRILEYIDPVRLASVHSGWWNDDEAIRLMSSEDGSRAHQLELAAMMLDGQYLSQTSRLVEQLKKWHKSNDDIELLRVEGELQVRLGDLSGGRGIFEKAAKHPKCKRGQVHIFSAAVAESYVYEHRHDKAADAYERALQVAVAELCRLTGENSLEDLADMPGNFYGKRREELVSVLWYLREIATNRSKCRKRLGSAALEDLLYARKAVDKIRLLEGTSSDSELQAAVTSAAIARQYYEMGQQADGEQSSDEAIRLYDDAIRACEQAVQQAGDDVRAVANLAWSYFGMASCLIQKLKATATNSSPESSLALAAERLARIVNRMPDTKAQPFLVQFSRACDLARTEAEKCAEHLRQGATNLLEGLIFEFELAELISVIGYLDGILETEPARQLGIDVEPELPLLKPSGGVEDKARELGLDDDEIARLRKGLYGLLRALATYANREELNKWLETSNLVIAAERSINQSYRLFSDLSLRTSRRPRAEGFYGQACLCAIEGNGAMAAKYLRLAGASAGENTVAYLNRSTLDEDLDSVREDKEFQVGPATRINEEGSTSQ